jgi:hypothetical protein
VGTLAVMVDVLVVPLAVVLAAAFLAVFAVMGGVSVREINRARARRNATRWQDARVGMAAYLASLVTSPEDAGARRRKGRR